MDQSTLTIDLCSDEEEDTQEPPTPTSQIHQTPKSSRLVADCNLCGQTFGMVATFMDHMRSYHRLTNLFDCESCHQIFLSEVGLKHHYATTHAAAAPTVLTPATTFSCDHCGDKFHHLEALEAHKDVHTIEKKFSIAAESENLEQLKKFSCPICLKNFFIEEALINHRKRKHSIRTQTFICDLCKKAHPSKKSLLMHRHWHFRRKLKTLAQEIMSNLDVTNTTSDSNPKTHHKQDSNSNLKTGAPRPIMKSKSEVKLKSNKVLAASNELEPNDSSSESGLDPKLKQKFYSCNKCNSVHSTKISLKNHRKQHILQSVAKNKNSINCTSCPAVFDSIYLLQKHLEEHILVKSYYCQSCPEKFGLLHNLKIHELTHSPSHVVCSTCGEPFPDKISLEEHKTQHSRIPVICTFCKKKFSSLKKLNEHIRLKHSKKIGWKVESDKNILKLKISSKLLSKEDSISHRKKNRGKSQRKAKDPAVKVRIHECKFCGKHFYHYYSYIQHMEVHPIAKKFSCSECNQTFGYSASLKSHNLILHTKSRLLFCANCYKPFNSKTKLTLHCRSYCHMKERNHVLVSNPRNEKQGEITGSTLKEMCKFQSLKDPKSYFSCRICYKLYTLEVRLLYHTIIAHPEQKFMLDSLSNGSQQSHVPVSSCENSDLVSLIQHFEDGKSSEAYCNSALPKESNFNTLNQSTILDPPPPKQNESNLTTILDPPPPKQDESNLSTNLDPPPLEKYVSFSNSSRLPLEQILADFETLLEDAVGEGDQNLTDILKI